MKSYQDVYYVSLGSQAITTVILLLVTLSSANESAKLLTLWLSEVHLLETVKARWSFYRMCELSTVYHTNIDCSKGQVAYPYSPYDNLLGSLVVPTSFQNRRSYFASASRTGFWFLLLGLILSILTLAFHSIRCCRRIARLGALLSPLPWVFVLIGASLITAVHNQGTKIFLGEGYTANIGGCCFSLLWTSVVLGLLGILLAFYNQYLDTFSAPNEHMEEPYDFQTEKQQLDLTQLLVLTEPSLSKRPLHPGNSYWGH